MPLFLKLVIDYNRHVRSMVQGMNITLPHPDEFINFILSPRLDFSLGCYLFNNNIRCVGTSC